MFDMLQNERMKIVTCHTDEGKGLIKSVEKNKISNKLCVFHMLLHSPDKAMFRKLVNAEDSKEYAMIKEDILTKHANLAKYLNTNNRWPKVSRFESCEPRDQNLATAAVESFNSFIERNKLKKQEPFIIFQEVYKFGYTTIQTKYHTGSASNWMSYALSISRYWIIFHASSQGIFEVAKINQKPRCTVTIIPGERPSCSCRFYDDCGMPCVHILAVARKYKIDWCP